jgi:hypothetical protein
MTTTPSLDQSRQAFEAAIKESFEKNCLPSIVPRFEISAFIIYERGFRNGAAWKPAIESLEPVAAVSANAALPVGAEAIAFSIPGFDQARIERVVQRNGDYVWAVRNCGSCLAKDGTWEYEPQPSNRDDSFIERCRFSELSDAFSTAILSVEGSNR